MSQAAPFPVARPVDGRAVASFILGLLSVVLFWLPPVSLVMGITGIVLAVLSRRDERTSFNAAGLVLSIVGTVLSLVPIVIGIIAILQQR